MTHNLGLEYLRNKGETIVDWDGMCMDLSQDIASWLDDCGVPCHRLWLEAKDKMLDAKGGYYWVYHVVVVVDNQVHDPWHPEVLPVDIYLKTMFPGQNVDVEKVEDDNHPVYEKQTTALFDRLHMVG